MQFDTCYVFYVSEENEIHKESMYVATEYSVQSVIHSAMERYFKSYT